MSVSVVTVAYNSGDALLRMLDSLETENVQQIVVIDNGDGGEEITEAERRPRVEVLRPGGNVGFAAGCNLGARHATGDVLLFLNPDTVVREGTVAKLAAAVEDDEVATAMAELVLASDPTVLNSAGAAIHITGLGWSAGHGRPVGGTGAGLREVTYCNGSVLAIRKALFDELGGFTEKLFLYHEDLELGWRARMRGYRNVLDPAAAVLHDYEHGRNPTKYYFMERNRIVFVSTAYSLRLLLLLAPVLLCAELGLTMVSIRERWFRAKASGWGWCARNAGWIVRHRRRIQCQRKVPDRELARFLTPILDPAMIEVPPLVGVVNPVLSGYWDLVRRLL